MKLSRAIERLKQKYDEKARCHLSLSNDGRQHATFFSNDCNPTSHASGELGITAKSKHEKLLQETYGKRMFETYMDILSDQDLWLLKTRCYIHDCNGKRSKTITSREESQDQSWMPWGS